MAQQLDQIAFSVVDVQRTERWFRDAFGFIPAGGTRSFRGWGARHVQGLPGAASTCWWLVDRSEHFQIELFQFEAPLARLMPADYRPCDVGYSRVGFWVQDFDRTIERLIALGTPPLTAPVGAAGKRRVCVRNPEGVFIEVMEDDPLRGRTRDARPGCRVAARSVTLSVADLEKSKRFFMSALGMPESTAALRRPEHEALWGLEGASTRSVVLEAGNVLVELVQYLDPVGKPWPEGHRISDQGILNIAFGYRNMRAMMDSYHRSRVVGARPNGFPLHLVNWGVVYVNDEQEFSVELLWVNPRWDARMGFAPLPLGSRPLPDTHRVESSVRIAAPVDRVWKIAADHGGMPRWFPVDSVTLERVGWPAPNGLGAERIMRGPKMNVSEQVTGWDPPHSIDYRLLSGAPISCHQGRVELEAVDGGTELKWSIRYRAKIPGTSGIVRRAMGKMLDDALPRLKKLSEAG
jgi:catechol 2,3-dioxygenase-like lactoylglutathione lyase family enzyme